MKNYKIFKAILFTLLAAICLVQKEFFLVQLDYLVGGIMLIYGLEEVLLHLLGHKKLSARNSFFWGITEILLGTITIFYVDQFETVCIIWAIWAILREAIDIEECVIGLFEKKPKILNISESIIAIIFSILLILNTTEHHAKTHIYLLAIELFTTGVVFEIEEQLILKYFSKKSSKNTQN